MEELWDLYESERIPTGKTVVRGESFPDGLLRVVIHISVINSAGKMLIQRRQPFKHGWPGMWDVTVGGHILSGETSSCGAQRELFEELGIEADMSNMRPSFTVNFRSGFDDYYILRMDPELSSLKLQPEEVCDAAWADEDEIFRLIDEGSFIPYRRSLISMLFEMKDGIGAHSATAG